MAAVIARVGKITGEVVARDPDGNVRRLKTGDPILRLENMDLRLDIMYREAQLYEQINNHRNTRIAMEQRMLQLRADLLEVDRMINESKRQYAVAVSIILRKLAGSRAERFSSSPSTSKPRAAVKSSSLPIITST